MFKRYQQAGVFEEEAVKERESEAPIRPPSQSAARVARPYLSEPVRPDPPPRIFEPAMPPPIAPSPEGYAKESDWAQGAPLESEEPETTLGPGVCFKGELSFERFLRIDGTFEGKLSSSGKLVVGPKGVVRSDDIQLREAIIEGRVEGDIHVEERLELRGDAVVRGNIEAQSLSVDEGVSLIGHVKVTPTSPEEEPV